jgi:hypothetical protein
MRDGQTARFGGFNRQQGSLRRIGRKNDFVAVNLWLWFFGNFLFRFVTARLCERAEKAEHGDPPAQSFWGKR